MIAFDQIDADVERMLDITARRQQALASNIANLDTPGYKAKDVAFQQELSSSMQLATTDPSHLTASSTASSTQLVETEGKVKQNGNNVDLERETTEMTKNGLQYIMLTQFMSSAVKTLRYSISEGGKV
jgi:flagellar basal-body rod protein FlgB